ncbi:MAG: hypothetical protein EOP53_03850 [Sphingobacteriales bacterium]|nr:MAG: hypothetical protein EOP53_03850 [Sphingobacteriales bacterium]
MPDINKEALQQRVEALEKENALLRRNFNNLPQGNTVSVPEALRPLFDVAEKTVNEYFRHLKMDPTKGTIEINDQRYVLVRASALSKDFLETIQKLYADRGEAEAMSIGKNFLFDIAHVIGMNDARNFHEKMNLTDPIAKLSAQVPFILLTRVGLLWIFCLRVIPRQMKIFFLPTNILILLKQTPGTVQAKQPTQQCVL